MGGGRGGRWFFYASRPALVGRYLTGLPASATAGPRPEDRRPLAAQIQAQDEHWAELFYHVGGSRPEAIPALESMKAADFYRYLDAVRKNAAARPPALTP